MRWNATQAVSSDIKINTKITDFNTFSIIVWNISGWTDNLGTFVFSSIQLISPNTFKTFTSVFFESIAKKIVFNTVSFSINILSWGTSWIDWDTDSVNWFFSGADAWCTKAVSSPFFTFVANFVASPSDAVEKVSSSTCQRSSVTDTVGKSVSSWALSTFGKIAVDSTSSWVLNTLTVLFVLSSWAVRLNTSSIY